MGRNFDRRGGRQEIERSFIGDALHSIMRYIVDIGLSLAYHGFKEIIVINRPGANMQPLELATRRIMLESDAWVGMALWGNLTQTRPSFMESWQESPFPGGCAHAGEMETSIALHLDPTAVRMNLVVAQVTDTNAQESKYHWVDAFGSGPIKMDGHTSTYSADGTQGTPSLGTTLKGKTLFEETVTNLVTFGDEFSNRRFTPRTDHHDRLPDIHQARMTGP